ncbi:MAG: FAD-dependent oxidoreductase [Eubacteriales bacterium]|nr:FAD-dependent oxidoreductase [Eubacteriales bacterium]
MVQKFRLNIDGKEVTALPGQTILDVAKENDIFIPTLCFDERTEIYGSCGLCMVEIEGNPKLWKACATEVTPGMVVTTKSKRIEESRKTNLELLLSNHVGDCRPPCAKACPAATDCQGYVGLVAEGRYEEAYDLIKTKIPIPASIGRVCPHPCEKDCRRGLVDEPIAIANLKRYAADTLMNKGIAFSPECEADTGKSVAVIGGGPYGLSVAYFLRQMGHAVTIFEAMPYAGGMLRYGIPEYRLPKSVLEEEINMIEDMGVEICYNTKIGRDISFDSIRSNFDAVCLGIGAWKSTGVGCEGEDAEGVIGGIDFLGKIVRKEPLKIGRRVAIVGGGNTAMDACRVAKRMGAEEVYNIYRRTIDAMPADPVEIEEATEEGVIFKSLRNPLVINKDENGCVKSVTLQVMELGEPDASGRRSPKAVPGVTEELELDMIILAIGQAVNPEGINGVELTRKKGIVYDKKTFMTAIPGVFAGGDCGNDKISIAVESIADARKSSYIIDAYLQGETVAYKPEYTVERTDITAKTFEDRERMCRPKMEQLGAEERKDNFLEVVKGYTEEQARAEASRCLECGCKDYYECKLVNYANQYDVHPERLAGDINKHEHKDDNKYILRDPNKCILCGKCVRACDEVMGVGVLGLVHRGFDTVVLPALGRTLEEAGCISCGQCVSCCPTGALLEVQPLSKQIPLETEKTEVICGGCSMGCSTLVETKGQVLVKANPDPEGAVNGGVLCVNGKFRFANAALGDNKLTVPMMKKDGEFTEIDYREAMVLGAKKLESLSMGFGRDAIAFAVSDRYTNEEAYVIKKVADEFGAKLLCFNNRRNALADVLGIDASPNTIDELLSTEVILAIGYNMTDNAVMRVKLMQAAKNGAKVVLINPIGMEQDHMSFAKAVYVDDSTAFLKELVKAIMESGSPAAVAAEAVEGYEELKASVAGVSVSEKAAEIAALYGGAKKAMIVYQQNVISAEAAELAADMAVISGHIGAPRNGIVLLKSKNNSQGLVDLGITAGAEALEGVKGLIIFGEAPDPELLKGIEFVMVVDTHMTPAAMAADVVVPGTAPIHADGCYTNTERRLQMTNAAVEPDVTFNNAELVQMLAEILEIPVIYEDVEAIEADMDCELAIFRNASDGEVLGGVLKPVKTVLAAAKDAKFADPMPQTDYLMSLR